MIRKILQKSKIVLGLWVIILSSIFLFNISYAQDNDATLTMPLSDAKKIVVNLEKSELYKKEITQLESGNNELSKQNKIMNNEIVILNDKIKIKDDQLKLSTDELSNQKKIYKEKVDVCEKSKPSIFNKLVTIFTSIGIGILIGGIVLR